MSEEFVLNELSVDHPMRNVPLSQLKVRYQWDGGGVFKDILPTFKISKSTFNQLGPAWTSHTNFYASYLQS